MTQYVIFNGATLRVNGFVDADELPAMDGWELAAMTAPVPHFPEGPTPTSALEWRDGVLAWVETAPLDNLKLAALDRPRADINAVVWDAVGNLTEEYKEAETEARAYKAAGYVGIIPPSVDCFAQHNPTGSVQTGQWAADDIIMRADAFAAAKLAMRQARFSSQSAMRAAATNAELDAAVAGWNLFIAQIRAQLGL